MTLRTLWAALGAALFLACSGESVPPAATIGNPAPSYRVVTVAGDSVNLEQFAGQAVLLNVWATWCEPCRKEMPGLEALHREFGPQGLTVLGASIDVRSADSDVRRFINDHDITFTILRDPTDRVSRTFQLAGVPNTVLIDRNGIITHRWIGEFDPLAEDAKETVRQVLSS